MRFPHFALGLCLMIAVPVGVRAADLTPSSVWMTDLAKAQAEARRLHRPLVAHFGNSRSCAPCRQMEAEVLNTQAILKLLDEGFVAVKVDLADRANGKYQTQFQIDAMPTDIILGHDGTELLHRSEGYTSAERHNYRAALMRVDAKYVKEGKRLSRGEPTTEIAKALPSAPATKAASVAEAPKPAAEKLVPEPVEPHRIDIADVIDRHEPVVPAIPSSPSVAFALDGYCPVTLRATRTWKKGDRQFTVSHEGQTFVFLSAKERDQFVASPARFAPRALGCDPVVLSENKLAIRGSTRFGAFYDGELFLFETAETRVKFRNDPARYNRIRQALRADEVQESRHVVDTAAK